eukprot:scaffold1875_cov339-Prasinococcus_capsulatus_cf.AAC.3
MRTAVGQRRATRATARRRSAAGSPSARRAQRRPGGCWARQVAGAAPPAPAPTQHPQVVAHLKKALSTRSVANDTFCNIASANGAFSRYASRGQSKVNRPTRACLLYSSLQGSAPWRVLRASASRR